MKKRAVETLKIVWMALVSITLVVAAMTCLNLQKQVTELRRLPKNELIPVAENRESIHKIIEKAVIDAVLGLVSEKEKLKEENGHDEQKPD